MKIVNCLFLLLFVCATVHASEPLRRPTAVRRASDPGSRLPVSVSGLQRLPWNPTTAAQQADGYIPLSLGGTSAAAADISLDEAEQKSLLAGQGQTTVSELAGEQKKAAAKVETGRLECPVCNEELTSDEAIQKRKISVCENNHLTCGECALQLNPKKCPKCRSAIFLQKPGAEQQLLVDQQANKIRELRDASRILYMKEKNWHIAVASLAGYAITLTLAKRFKFDALQKNSWTHTTVDSFFYSVPRLLYQKFMLPQGRLYDYTRSQWMTYTLGAALIRGFYAESRAEKDEALAHLVSDFKWEAFCIALGKAIRYIRHRS